MTNAFLQTDSEFNDRGRLRKSDPDYVFARARDLFQKGRTVSEEEDRLVDAALHFLKLYAEGGAEAELALRTTYRYMLDAYDLWRSPYYGRPLLIECGILAGADSRAISEAVGADEKSVQTYEQLFFDIRENLSNEAFITQNVIGLSPQMQQGLQREGSKKTILGPEHLHQLLAYCCGWDTYLDFVSRPAADHSEALKTLSGVVNSHEAFKVALGIIEEDVNRSTLAGVLERYMEMGEQRTGLKDVQEQERQRAFKELIIENPMNVRTARPDEYVDEVEEVPAQLPGAEEQVIQDERVYQGRTIDEENHENNE